MRLNAPKKLTLLIAVIIAIIALVAWLAVAFGFTTLSLCVSVYAFWAMVIAFVLLLCGCMLKGL